MLCSLHFTSLHSSVQLSSVQSSSQFSSAQSIQFSCAQKETHSPLSSNFCCRLLFAHLVTRTSERNSTRSQYIRGLHLTLSRSLRRHLLSHIQNRWRERERERKIVAISMRTIYILGSSLFGLSHFETDHEMSKNLSFPYNLNTNRRRGRK